MEEKIIEIMKLIKEDSWEDEELAINVIGVDRISDILEKYFSEYRQSLIASIEEEIAKTKRCECSKCNEIEGNYNMGNNQCLEEVKEILNKYK